MRLNRTFLCASSLSDIIRLTAVVTATGFLTMPAAHADAERPTPATQPGAAPKQDAPAPVPAPATEPAPAAPADA